MRTPAPWTKDWPTLDPVLEQDERSGHYRVASCEWPGDAHQLVGIDLITLENIGLVDCNTPGTFDNLPDIRTAFPWQLRFIRADIVTLEALYMREEGLWRTQAFIWNVKRLGRIVCRRSRKAWRALLQG